jgi:hypothetical protein
VLQRKSFALKDFHLPISNLWHSAKQGAAQALRSGVVEAAAVSSPFDLALKAERLPSLRRAAGYRVGLTDIGHGGVNASAAAKSAAGKARCACNAQGAPLVFDNKKEVVPFMLRFLDQSQEVAERSYELLVASLSRNGEITDQEWEILTEKKRPLEEVRDFTLLREAGQELKIR